MTDKESYEKARDPQDLELLLIARQWAGDVDGMAALYARDAVLDSGEGQLTRGRQAIGDLALTSTHLPDGSVTAEVARRQSDGTWLWVIDRYSVTWKSTADLSAECC